jgi:hypothetical protein
VRVNDVVRFLIDNSFELPDSLGVIPGRCPPIDPQETHFVPRRFDRINL